MSANLGIVNLALPSSRRSVNANGSVTELPHLVVPSDV